MNIANLQDINSYLNKFRHANDIEIFNNPMSNREIKMSLSDRPGAHTISQGELGKFFIEYERKCDFLASIIGINTNNEIQKMIDFINGRNNKIDIYHYSIFPKKIYNNRISFSKYYLVALDETKFKKLSNSHNRFGVNSELIPDLTGIYQYIC